MANYFYDDLVLIESFLSITDPNTKDAKEFSNWLIIEKYARYAFERMQNHKWIRSFYELGIFNNPPPPLEDSKNPGFFSMPAWYAGEYLEKFAEKEPEIVLKVALNLETENSRALRTMLEAILKIPPEFAEKTVSSFKRWSETKFVGFMMLSIEMGKIMGYLAKNDQIEAALQVLDVLTEPIQRKQNQESKIFIAGTSFDFYWLNKALQDNLIFLIEKDPIAVQDILCQKLQKSIDFEGDPRIEDPEKKQNSNWRYSIAPQKKLSQDRDIKNLLVNLLIQALDKGCEQDKEKMIDILDKYIENDYSIIVRIAIYILRVWGEKYPELIEKAYRLHKEKQIPVDASEFMRFFEIQFGHFPKEIQEEYIETIKYGPSNERIAEVFVYSPDQLVGDTIEQKKIYFIQNWQLHQLSPISNYLKEDLKDFYKILVDKYGEPSPPVEKGITVASFSRLEDKFGFDEFTEKSVEEVFDYIQVYKPSEKIHLSSYYREALGNKLEEDVRSRPLEYLENIELLKNDKLHFVFHTNYFRALETAVENKVQITFESIIDLADYIVHQIEEKPDVLESELGLSNAKRALASLFEKLLREKNPQIDDNLLDRIGGLICELIYQDDPVLDTDKDVDDLNSLEQTTMDTNMDAATRSLNCVRGMAMHCLISYGLYFEKRRKLIEGKNTTPVIHPLVKMIVDEKLDKTKRPSLAVHSVMGWYFPQLFYLDKEWAKDRIGEIFPINKEEEAYFNAAWGAYIRFSDVYKNVFPALEAQYRYAITQLEIAKSEQDIDRIDERLATHLLKAYLWDLIDIGSKDQLLVSFYKNANDEARAHGGFWLSEVMKDNQPNVDDPLWKKIWSLWQWRLKEASQLKNIKDNVEEISNYCRLLKYVPLKLNEMAETLNTILKFESERYHIHLIIEYLSENSEDYPDISVSLLNKIVESEHAFFMGDETRSNFSKIFKNASSADKETKEIAIQIINVLGEHGDYEWRPYLDILKVSDG